MNVLLLGDNFKQYKFSRAPDVRKVTLIGTRTALFGRVVPLLKSTVLICVLTRGHVVIRVLYALREEISPKVK